MTLQPIDNSIVGPLASRPRPVYGSASVQRIERKSLLYKSGLGFWCVNHVQGCSHACRYPCYAFMMARSHGRARTMAEWAEPKLVGNALSLLERELSKRRDIDCVHLCLTTDPFMYEQPEVTTLSLQVIEAINRRGIACSILTKGLLPAELGDSSRFSRQNSYGISLVSVSEEFRQRWEPGASPYAQRIVAARALHEQGCRTLVHIEPYPTPNIIEQDLETILQAVAFVDHVFFGGWNYNPIATSYPQRQDFYREQASIVRRFCQRHGIECETWL